MNTSSPAWRTAELLQPRGAELFQNDRRVRATASSSRSSREFPVSCFAADQEQSGGAARRPGAAGADRIGVDLLRLCRTDYTRMTDCACANQPYSPIGFIPISRKTARRLRLASSAAFCAPTTRSPCGGLAARDRHRRKARQRVAFRVFSGKPIAGTWIVDGSGLLDGKSLMSAVRDPKFLGNRKPAQVSGPRIRSTSNNRRGPLREWARLIMIIANIASSPPRRMSEQKACRFEHLRDSRAMLRGPRQALREAMS